MNRRLLPLLCFVVAFAAACATAREGGDINEPYRHFTKGYAALDAAELAQGYAADATYVQPPPTLVQRGREEIRADFARGFEAAAKSGSRRAIAFRVLKREVHGDLAYDIGFARVTAIPAEGAPRQSYGKWVVVLRRDADGVWRFVADCYSPADQAMFETSGSFDPAESRQK
jgi:uncharacterized protein (TIGR02246 family)